LYLLFGDAHVIRYIGKDGGLNIEALQSGGFATALQLGPFTDATLDEFQHPGLLRLTDLWEGRGGERGGETRDEE